MLKQPIAWRGRFFRDHHHHRRLRHDGVLEGTTGEFMKNLPITRATLFASLLMAMIFIPASEP